MGVYKDYECHDCALVFTAKVALDDRTPSCPYCESPNVSWRPAVIAVVKKGPGWTPKFYGKEVSDE